MINEVVKLNIYGAAVVVKLIIFILPFCLISEMLEIEYKLFGIVINCVTITYRLQFVVS